MEGIGIGVLLGGVGLFLLGMALMTDGLKMAAGPALGAIISASTQTRWRGLLSGIVVTALVQSSSAVTVAAIGFVNAGLLTLGQSLWVLFGANVGTTMTGWLVALVGLKIKVEAAALPLIALGMALRISGPETRRGAIGGALTGFGVLFLGIAFIQQGFAGSEQALDLASLSGRGVLSVAAFVLAGILLTVLMQASAAALVIVLTLAQAGIIPLSEAAAAVIGANIGTTVTAAIAVIGATPNARRAALAHVLFNLLTGVVALLMLPLMLAGVAHLRDAFALESSPAVSLALFHTLFNLLGVALMWPLTGRLTLFLQGRFRTREEEVGRPQHIDHNVASVPSLAADALRREMLRLGAMTLGGVRARTALLAGQPALPDDSAAQPGLSQAMRAFLTEVTRHAMSARTASTLALLLRIQAYYDLCQELAPDITVGREAVAALAGSPLHAELGALASHAGQLFAQFDPAGGQPQPATAEQLAAFEAEYQAVKAALLAAGADGRLAIAAMDALTRSFSVLRRILDQAAKAARLLDGLRREVPAGALPGNDTA
jgi:phosphate:Na+ symporter